MTATLLPTLVSTALLALAVPLLPLAAPVVAATRPNVRGGNRVFSRTTLTQVGKSF